MTVVPSGLPPLVDTNGQWGVVLQRLYGHFCAYFRSQPLPVFQGRVVTFDGRCLNGDPHEEGFWHVVTKGPPNNRLFDPPRAERILWIPAMLDGSAPGVSRWEYQEGSGTKRLYFWIENDDYVLILEDIGKTYRLVTAYFVEGWGRKDLAKKRAKGTAF